MFGLNRSLVPLFDICLARIGSCEQEPAHAGLAQRQEGLASFYRSERPGKLHTAWPAHRGSILVTLVENQVTTVEAPSFRTASTSRRVLNAALCVQNVLNDNSGLLLAGRRAYRFDQCDEPSQAKQQHAKRVPDSDRGDVRMVSSDGDGSGQQKAHCHDAQQDSY